MNQRYPRAISGCAKATEWPFLLKILSCEQPLSIQCHPSSQQAIRLHRENPQLYPDGNAKPEILIALTPFRALAGFRNLPDTLPELHSLAAFSPWLRLWQNEFPQSCRGLCQALFALPGHQQQEMLAAAERESQSQGTNLSPANELFLTLASFAPADPGAAFAFLLQEVRLVPGQALFLPPGQLHAYLYGTGIEYMAPSDNVIRAGLTSKTRDEKNFWRCADFTAAPPHLFSGRRISAGRQEYALPESNCRLEILRQGEFPLGDKPGILLLLAGEGELGCPSAPDRTALAGSAWLRPAALKQATVRFPAADTLAIWAHT